MTNITDQMIDAGAAILDPMLSSHCPRQVARDVYAAMEEARRDGDPTDVAPPKTTLRCPPASEFRFLDNDTFEDLKALLAGKHPRQAEIEAKAKEFERRHCLSATSDGRW